MFLKKTMPKHRGLHLALVLLAPAACISLSGCEGHGLGTPEGAGVKFMQALFEGDLETATALYNFSEDPNHQKMQEQMISGYAQQFYHDCRTTNYCLGEISAKAEGDPDLAGQGSTVGVRFEVTMTNGEMPPEFTRYARLIKLGDGWKVTSSTPEAGSSAAPGSVVPGLPPPGSAVPGLPENASGTEGAIPVAPEPQLPTEDTPREQAAIIGSAE